MMLVGGDRRRTVRGGGHRRGRRGSRRRLLLAVGEALRRPRGRPRGGRRGHDPDRPVRERRGRRRDGGGGRRGRRGQDQVHHRMDITLSVVSVGRPAHNSSLTRTVIPMITIAPSGYGRKTEISSECDGRISCTVMKDISAESVSIPPSFGYLISCVPTMHQHIWLPSLLTRLLPTPLLLLWFSCCFGVLLGRNTRRLPLRD